MPTPPIIEPIVDEAVQEVTPANANNSTAAKRPVTQLEEPSLYLINVEIEVMFKKELDRAATAPKALDLKPPHLGKVAEKEFPAEYKVLKFQKFKGRKGNTKEHVAYFLDSMEGTRKIKSFVFESSLSP